MSRTILTPETIAMMNILQLMVDALNMAFMAKDEAFDRLCALEDEELDTLAVEEAKDWVNDTQERLWQEIKERAEAHNMELRFNRLDGSFVLLDVQS